MNRGVSRIVSIFSCSEGLENFIVTIACKIPVLYLSPAFQILNAAYHVEVTFHSGSTVTRMLWEQIKQVWASFSLIFSMCHCIVKYF